MKMKQFIVKTIMKSIMLLIQILPYCGLAFLVCMAIFGYLGFISDTPHRWAELTFYSGVCVYIASALFTSAVMLTMTYKHCCFGLNTFKNHITHMKNTGEVFSASIFWPFSWPRISKNLSGWGIYWIDEVISCVLYWVGDRSIVIQTETFSIDNEN